jgi:formylglycine-generating enzyme required for sulfatase activity
MGSDPGEGIQEWETPLHEVTLAGYRIGKYPVTNREYAEFIRKEKGQEAPRTRAGSCASRQPTGSTIL